MNDDYIVGALFGFSIGISILSVIISVINLFS